MRRTLYACSQVLENQGFSVLCKKKVGDREGVLLGVWPGWPHIEIRVGGQEECTVMRSCSVSGKTDETIFRAMLGGTLFEAIIRRGEVSVLCKSRSIWRHNSRTCQ